MTLTTKLVGKTWGSADYYNQAKLASETTHPALVFLQKRYKDKNILEVGCGEGTKLSGLHAKTKTGVDISPLAISQASSKLDYAIVADATNLPLKDFEFDAVLSFFSMEHFETPEKVLLEMMRVLKSKGELVVVTPNFGAPNQSSPCYTGNRISKLLTGLWHDFFPPSCRSSLAWHHVTPLSLKEAYIIDFDTLVEPYIGTLKSFLQSQGFQVIHEDTNWTLENHKLSPHQTVFRFLASHHIFPFYEWGPHIFIIAQKP